LEYATIGWMVVEASVAIASGLAAHSIALIGFGLDSVIELLAAAVVVWQLRGGDDERREARAIRFIGATFFVLAAYLVVEGIKDLATHARSEASAPGIVVAGAALVVMPLFAFAKLRTGKALGNRTLIADAAETAFCAWLSGAALIGLGLNAVFGAWWADPVAALVIAGFALREGLEAWRGENETTSPFGASRTSIG